MSIHKAFHAERPPGSSHTWWCWLAQDCGSVLLWRWSSVHVKCYVVRKHALIW